MINSWVTWKNEELIARGILEIGDGYRAKNSEMGKDGLPFARAGNIDNGFHLDDADILENASVKKAGSKIAVPKDIVFTSKGTVGRFAFVKPETPKFVYSPQLCYWRIKDVSIIDPRFLFYWMHGSEFKKQVHQVKSLTTMADYVSLSDQRKMLIIAPPLATQHKIASILSAYDDLIENNTRRITVLEEMAQSLYQEWFVHFRFPGHEKKRMLESQLGWIPEGWEVVKIKDIAKIYRGRSYTSQNLGAADGLPFLNLKCIERDGGFRHDGLKSYRGPFKETQTAQTGDIIMAVTDVTQERRLVARAARVPRKGIETFVFSMDLVKIIPSDGINLNYLYGFFRFSAFPDEVKQYANGANVLHLAPERIEDFTFPLAPASLRNRFSEISSLIYEECDALQMKNTNLRRTRDLLLPKLISGEIDVERLDIEVGEEASREALGVS